MTPAFGGERPLKRPKTKVSAITASGIVSVVVLEHGLDELRIDPHTGKALKGELKGYWSFRVGVYRIIYAIRNKEVVVEVLRIHHRKEAYEKMRRL